MKNFFLSVCATAAVDTFDDKVRSTNVYTEVEQIKYHVQYSSNLHLVLGLFQYTFMLSNNGDYYVVRAVACTCLGFQVKINVEKEFFKYKHYMNQIFLQLKYQIQKKNFHVYLSDFFLHETFITDTQRFFEEYPEHALSLFCHQQMRFQPKRRRINFKFPFLIIRWNAQMCLFEFSSGKLKKTARRIKRN